MKTIIIDGVEYNLTPKVAFREGDWVVSPNGVYWHIDKISNNRYEVTSNTGESSSWNLDTNIYHKFTIQDAKDGDVLCDYCEEFDNPLIFILRKFERVDFGLVKPSDYSSYCFLTAGDRQVFKEGKYHHKHNIKPATKERRDLLFAKMKEAGYEWDADKKELKKIEQKPTWSEEDEEIYRKCICAMRASACGFPEEEKFVEQVDNWFKSLKDRYTWKPSNEQFKVLNEVLNFSANHESPHWNDYIFGTLNNLIRQLKKL